MKKHEYVTEWINKADHDLSTAKIIFLQLPEYFDVIGFHCQQAIEKYFKGYLTFIDIDFEFKHDLIYLLDLIVPQDACFDQFYMPASVINDYAVKIRYSFSKQNPSKEELEQMIALADKIHELVIKKIED